MGGDWGDGAKTVHSTKKGRCGLVHSWERSDSSELGKMEGRGSRAPRVRRGGIPTKWIPTPVQGVIYGREKAG